MMVKCSVCNTQYDNKRYTGCPGCKKRKAPLSTPKPIAKPKPSPQGLFRYDSGHGIYILTKDDIEHELFMQGYYQSLATQRNHLPLTDTHSQTGYMRSSDNPYKKHPTTPINPSFRNPRTIGAANPTSQLSGIDAMKQGFSLPLASQAEIIAKGSKRVLKKDAEKLHGLRQDLVGKRYDQGNLEDEGWFATHNSGASVPSTLKYEPINLSDDVVFVKESSKINHVNQQLITRYASCTSIANTLKRKLIHVFVAAQHGYPCLGIAVTIPANFNTGDGTNGETELWTIFCMYVFLGICKAGEREHGFEVLARSSLGHLETSVADSWQTFRINVGLIGPLQENLLMSYLTKLNEYLIALFGSSRSPKNSLYTADAKIIVNNLLFSMMKTDRVGILYAKDKNQNLFVNLIHRVADAIARKREINLLNTLTSNGGILTTAFRLGPADEKSSVIDEALLKILEQHYSVKFKKIPTFTSYPQLLREYIGGAIFNKSISGQTQGKDGYGSDSEDEDEVEKQKIYAKKITLPWGMRAISCAIAAVHWVDEHYSGLEYSSMYYETSDVTERQLRNTERSKSKKKIAKSKVGLEDINYFHNKHPLSLEETMKRKDKVIYQIWDITSATEEAIGTLANDELVKNKALQYILLVASGTKHEYGGLDIGGHGTIRVFSKNKKLRDTIYTFINERANTPVPWFNNSFRRGFKDQLGAPTNRGILNYMMGKGGSTSSPSGSHLGGSASGSQGPSTPLSAADIFFNQLLLIPNIEKRQAFYKEFKESAKVDKTILEMIDTILKDTGALDSLEGGLSAATRGKADSSIMNNTCWAYRFFKNLQHNPRMKNYYRSSIQETLGLYNAEDLEEDHDERLTFLRELQLRIRDLNNGNLIINIRWFIENFFPLHFGADAQDEVGQQQGIEDVEQGLRHLIDGRAHLGQRVRLNPGHFVYQEYNIFNKARISIKRRLTHYQQGAPGYLIARQGGQHINDELPVLRGAIVDDVLSIGRDHINDPTLINGHNAPRVGLIRRFGFLVAGNGIPNVPYITVSYGWQDKAPSFAADIDGSPGIWITNQTDGQTYFFRLNAVDVHTGGRNRGHWFGANLTDAGWVETNFAAVKNIDEDDIIGWIADNTSDTTEMYFRFIPTNITRHGGGHYAIAHSNKLHKRKLATKESAFSELLSKKYDIKAKGELVDVVKLTSDQREVFNENIKEVTIAGNSYMPNGNLHHVYEKLEDDNEDIDESTFSYKEFLRLEALSMTLITTSDLTKIVVHSSLFEKGRYSFGEGTKEQEIHLYREDSHNYYLLSKKEG